MKSLYAIIAALLLCSAAAYGASTSHVGTYHYRANKADITKLYDDGTFKIFQNGMVFQGEYKLKNEKLDFIIDGVLWPGKLADGVMYDNEGKPWDKAEPTEEDAKFIKITSLTNRFEVLGVSVLPPQEDGWHYSKVHPARIEFNGIGDRESQSLAGAVILSKLPTTSSKEEFMKIVSEQRARNTGNPRFENLINDEVFSSEKDTPAVRYHTKYKDFGATNLPKGAKYLIVEDIGIMCCHPENRNVGVTIALSQRSLPGDAIENFEKLANDFIKNVEFIPLPQ